MVDSLPVIIGINIATFLFKELNFALSIPAISETLPEHSDRKYVCIT